MFLRIAQLDAKTLQHVVDRIESHSRTADSVYTTTSREQAEASVAGGSGKGPEGSGEAAKTVRIEEPKRESRFDVRDMGFVARCTVYTFPLPPQLLCTMGCEDASNYMLFYVIIVGQVLVWQSVLGRTGAAGARDPARATAERTRRAPH
jgi:hypothetical protein